MEEGSSEGSDQSQFRQRALRLDLSCCRARQMPFYAANDHRQTTPRQPSTEHLRRDFDNYPFLSEATSSSNSVKPAASAAAIFAN